MPETQDWAAAPQTGVSFYSNSFTATEAAADFLLGLNVAGQQIVLVGIDLAANAPGGGLAALRGIVQGQLVDSVSLLSLVNLAIAPGAPYAASRPPFGALKFSAGADIHLFLQSELGVGSQDCYLTVYYFYLKA